MRKERDEREKAKLEKFKFLDDKFQKEYQSVVERKQK